jgi:hypothetical protein
VLGEVVVVAGVVGVDVTEEELAELLLFVLDADEEEGGGTGVCAVCSVDFLSFDEDWELFPHPEKPDTAIARINKPIRLR